MDLASEWLAKETLRALFMPPGCLVLLLTIGLWRWQHPYGRRLAGLSTALLYLLSSPIMAGWLMTQVEAPPLPANAPLKQIDAIVCLGGGKRFSAFDQPRGETVNDETLARLRHAARLQRQTGKPLLVSGGSPAGGIAEAELMREILTREFNVPVQWIEAGSNDTRDNATMSAALLQPKHRHILLVSSAYHLSRARRAFEAAGFKVTLAPTDYASREPLNYLAFLPRASAFRTSSTALRELTGSLWYRFRQ
ncbi:Uncharacterized SAM-binding protein YcdF, DUF218 family [Formivibrio citricus]|uniref:Uncharacterized SAM-binding protein YcdF, DUF218 family n=1 Tax=Formivibrio citricus TaxID=83765 RepID=A0A1I5B747_9NEIS|nr:YdcF family protein [Formivibrio citricus]SFN70319.1 Uncharacterized SAM-binding protein YcdF, DUF218 family [Formivibrio citricus]